MATFYLNHESELYHYGVKGMKWGKHKYADDYMRRNGKSPYARINNMKKLSKTAVPDRVTGSYSMNEDVRRAHNNAETQHEAEIRARREALKSDEPTGTQTKTEKSPYARINNMKKLSRTAVPDRVTGSYSANEDVRRAHNNAEKQRKAEIRAQDRVLAEQEKERRRRKSVKKANERSSISRNAQYYRGKR